jgi:splicing factor 3B subunit 3
VNEWKAPGKRSIFRCAVNQRQVVIALTGGELVYFEMDPVSFEAFMRSVVTRTRGRSISERSEGRARRRENFTILKD